MSMTRRSTRKNLTMTKMTRDQRDTLDRTVLSAILDAAQRPRAADLLRVPAVLKVIAALPRGKEDFRYLDSALQRLRKKGCIEAIRGGHWRVLHGKP